MSRKDYERAVNIITCGLTWDSTEKAAIIDAFQIFFAADTRFNAERFRLAAEGKTSLRGGKTR